MKTDMSFIPNFTHNVISFFAKCKSEKILKHSVASLPPSSNGRNRSRTCKTFARHISSVLPSPIGLPFQRMVRGSNSQGLSPRQFSKLMPSPAIGLTILLFNFQTLKQKIKQRSRSSELLCLFRRREGYAIQKCYRPSLTFRFLLPKGEVMSNPATAKEHP